MSIKQSFSLTFCKYSICLLLMLPTLHVFSETLNQSDAKSTLIINATVIDGTGGPSQTIDVRIKEQQIVALGELTPAVNDTVINASGLHLAPGFIDTHSHHDEELETKSDVLAAVSQGITTIVIGQDGDSHFPIKDFWAMRHSQPAAVNIASYVGHNTLRTQVMGANANRQATEAEIRSMERLLQQELDAGALGLSTGLEYDSGIFSTQDEVLQLAKVAAKNGARYISHIRSEAGTFEAAIEEIITIGKEAKLPVQISHIKLARRDLWGKADELIARLDKARAEGVDITADIYPYTYWMSTLQVLFPERDFDNIESAEYALSELASPEGMILSVYEPDPGLVGKSIAEIAIARGQKPAVVYMALIAESIAYQELNKLSYEKVESVIGTSMVEQDIEKLMQWPHSNICSDGTPFGLHPRDFGSFTRVLGRYSRQNNILSLENAVHKMTGLSAQHVGIKNRGVIKLGAFADLVLFDANAVIDQATVKDASKVSLGIEKVWVNGQLVFNQQKATGATPGQNVMRLSGGNSSSL
jgi:N-acyl-D-amino-acid deacylase